MCLPMLLSPRLMSTACHTVRAARASATELHRSQRQARLLGASLLLAPRARPLWQRCQGSPACPVLGLVAQLCPTLCDPRDCIACQAPLSMGILQARILDWVAMLSSRGSSLSRYQTQVSCIMDVLSKHLLNEQTGGMLKWKGWSDVHLSCSISILNYLRDTVPVESYPWGWISKSVKWASWLGLTFQLHASGLPGGCALSGLRAWLCRAGTRAHKTWEQGLTHGRHP